MSNDNIYNIEIAGFGNIAYQINGNEIKLCDASDKKYDNVNKIQNKVPAFFTPTATNNIDINKLTISDFYNSSLNSSFVAYNPPELEVDALFYKHEEYNELIGLKYILIDTETDESANTIFYRNSIGDLMEIIYIISHIGEEFYNKKGHICRFGTVFGINDIFLRYMRLIDSEPSFEQMRRVMYYISGLVKGYCKEKAINVQMMLDIIENVCKEYLVIKEVI